MPAHLGFNNTPDNRRINYYAIIGDIIKSKSISNRSEVQKDLEDVFKHINEKYHQNIAAKFLVTLGDEFQGLLVSSGEVYEIVLEIVERLEPVQIRFGIGYGTIETDLKEFALGIDGNAFYSAREALNQAHRKHDHAIGFVSSTINKQSEIAISTIFNLLAQIRNLWTVRQKEIYRMTRGGHTQKEIAKELKISQSAVSQQTRKARIEEVLEAQKKLSTLFISLHHTEYKP